MLEEEGFTFDRYIDIFDGGPTVTAHIDDLRTVDESEEETIAEIAPGGKYKMLLAHGRLKDFKACFASVKRVGRKSICIDPEAAELIGVKEGDKVLAVKR
jgi:arginine N-succinyltransferase